MKLQHLPIGARFEYKGQIFVKTGPLTAASEPGGQQVIPRSAVLRPLEAPVAEVNGKGRQLDETKVRAAFDHFYRTCSGLLDESSRQPLADARATFLQALK